MDLPGFPQKKARIKQSGLAVLGWGARDIQPELDAGHPRATGPPASSPGSDSPVGDNTGFA